MKFIGSVAFTACLLGLHNFADAGNSSLMSAASSSSKSIGYLANSVIHSVSNDLSGKKDTSHRCLQYLSFNFECSGNYLKVNCNYHVNNRVYRVNDLLFPEGFNQLCSVDQLAGKVDVDADMEKANCDIYPHFNFNSCRIERRYCRSDSPDVGHWLIIEDLKIRNVKSLEFVNNGCSFRGIVLEFSDEYPYSHLHINELSLNNVSGLRVYSKKHFSLSIDKILNCCCGNEVTEISSVFPITLRAPLVDGQVVFFEKVGIESRDRIVINKLSNGTFGCKMKQGFDLLSNKSLCFVQSESIKNMEPIKINFFK